MTATKASAASRHRSRPSNQSPKAPAAGTLYIESSALIAALLEGDAAAKKSIRTAQVRITSALTLAESTRAIRRARVSGRLTQEQERAALRALQLFARRCAVMSVTDSVLARVGRPFPVEPVRTLDAIHLATLEALDEPPALVTVITRDVRVQQNAIVLGYAVE